MTPPIAVYLLQCHTHLLVLVLIFFLCALTVHECHVIIDLLVRMGNDVPYRVGLLDDIVIKHHELCDQLLSIVVQFTCIIYICTLNVIQGIL